MARETTDPIVINENHLKDIIDSMLSELGSGGIDPRERTLFIAKNAAIMYSERTGLNNMTGEITSFDVVFPLIMALIDALIDARNTR